MNVATIADALGVHGNTVRFHLDALVAAGLVERVATPSTRAGRPPMAFRACPGMDPSGPRNYVLLARVLADDLAARPAPVRRAVEAGRAWGTRLVPGPAGSKPVGERTAVRRLLGLLAEVGFDPVRRTSPTGPEIGLRHCPFLDLIETHAQVICSIHLGLMQGAMAALDAPVTVDRLEPLVEPALCVAALAPRASGQQDGATPTDRGPAFS